MTVFSFAGARGEKTPADWLQDSQRRSMLDPEVFYGPPRGSLKPFGGSVTYKGYSLGLVVDIFGGAFSWSGTGIHSKGKGTLMIAINIASIRPLVEFKASVDSLIRDCKDAPLAPGFTFETTKFPEVLAPSDPERLREPKSRKDGLFVSK